MRSNARRRHVEEEEESAFVSMTDMTVSFLFIVMLLLAFFASQYNDEKTVPQSVHEAVLAERDGLVESLSLADERIAELEAQIARLRQHITVLRTAQDVYLREIARLDARIEELVAEIADLRSRLAEANPLETYINRSMVERRELLERLRDELRIDFPDLDVILSEQSDALRFQGDGLFRSGEAQLRSDRRPFVEAVAARLQQILPCYTLGPQARWQEDCNRSLALIEAVQIEGHTDSDGGEIANLVLSTARANQTFQVMTEHRPDLTRHLNFRGQPVMSVAGYGEMRPVVGNDTVQDKATNRRIDMRIIMYVPSASAEIETIRAALADAAREPRP